MDHMNDWVLAGTVFVVCFLWAYKIKPWLGEKMTWFHKH